MADISGASSGPGSTRSAPEAPSGLRPSGDDPSRGWPLQPRHQRLPKWARLEIRELRCAEINSEMAPDIRGVAKEVLGGNCTFSDDDLSLLAGLAIKAIDAGLHHEIKDRCTVENIERARSERCHAQGIETRSAKTEGLGPQDESPVTKSCAQGAAS